MSTPTVSSWFPTPGEQERARVLIGSVARIEQEINRLEARKARLLALLVDDVIAQQARSAPGVSDDLPMRSAAAEIAAVSGVGQRTMMARMSESWTLRERFPATLAAMDAGDLSRRHASVIVDEGLRLGDDASRAAYEEQAIPAAKSGTVAAAREACRRFAEAAQPVALAERHREARQQRGVFVRPLEDGMAELCLVASAPLVQGAHDRLTQMAKSVKRAATRGAGGADAAREGLASAGAPTVDSSRGEAAEPSSAASDARTLDQLRADIAVDLLLSGAPQAHVAHDATGANALDGIRGTVQVTIPVRTVIGIGEDAAFLAGYGPIDSDTARRLAASAPGWERLFRDPDTGALRAADHYLPTAAQRRFLHARDEHCRFPGCRLPARRCDIDHTVAFAEGGRTSVANLGVLCRGHHVLKHNSPWRVRQREDGELEWISPTGRRIVDRPESAVRFVDSAESDAAAVGVTVASARSNAPSGDPPIP
ncbi:HNH endonuclease signature motif containing protein [Microbacterium petrolearium]